MLLTDVYGTGYEFYADFGASPLTGDAPLEVTFTDSSVGDIQSWHWEFGDGDTSTVQNPTHTYQYDGFYTVSLTVQDNYHSNTLTQERYINVIGHPLISSPDTLGIYFGIVYLSDVSGDSLVVIQNVGTDTVIVSGLCFIDSTGVFNYSYANLGNPILPTELDTIFVNFEPPIYSGAMNYRDTLLIGNNSENKPELKIPLYGIGEYVPPAPPTGVQISIDSVNAVITWNPVDTTIYGTPITPDGYIVLYNETPYEDDQYFYYLDFTPDTTYTHTYVAQYRDQMYYKVVAVKNYRCDLVDILANISKDRNNITWFEIKTLLDKKRNKCY